MMGVTDFQLAASWWVLFVSESLICTGLVMVTARTTYPESDLVIVFFYFFMFLMSCTSYCIFLSNFFDKANMGEAQRGRSPARSEATIMQNILLARSGARRLLVISSLRSSITSVVDCPSK